MDVTGPTSYVSSLRQGGKKRESFISRYKRSKAELGTRDSPHLASIEEALTDRSQISRERQSLCARIFRQSWWNPRFYSSPLEKQLQKKAIDFLRNRFRITTICLSVFSLLWIVVFSINIPASEQPDIQYYSPNYSVEMIVAGAVFFVLSLSLVILSLTKLYNRWPVMLSYALCFLLIISSWLLVPSILVVDKQPAAYSSISLINQFALTTVVVLVIYTLLHKPIIYCVALGAFYAVVLEGLVIVFGYGLLSGGSNHDDSYVFNTELIVRLTIGRVLLQLCLNAVGISTAYWFQVRLHDTFWKIVQCLILQKALGLDRELHEKTLSSLMPDQLAAELIDDDFARKCMMFAIQKNQPEYDHLNLPRPFPIHHQDNVSILFADIVGFTALSANMSAESLVNILNEIFSTFDILAVRHGCEKVCTLGDCYFCVSGCPAACESHAANAVDMGMAIQDALMEYSERNNLPISMRVGVHTGSVYFGVMGCRRFKFDVWSEDVNLANQIESSGIPGKVVVSEATKRELSVAYLLEEIPAEELDPAIRHVQCHVVNGRRLTLNCSTWRKKIKTIDVQMAQNSPPCAPVPQRSVDARTLLRRALTCCCPFKHRDQTHLTTATPSNISTNPIIDIISKQGQLERTVSLTQLNNPFSEHQSTVITEVMELLQEKDINFDTFFSTSLHPIFLQFDDEELEKSYRTGGLHLDGYVKGPGDEFGLVVARRSYLFDVVLSLLLLLFMSAATFALAGGESAWEVWIYWGVFLGFGVTFELSIALCVASALWPRKFPDCFSRVSKLVMNWKVKYVIGMIMIYYPMLLVIINLSFLCRASVPSSLEGVAYTEMSFFIAMTVLVGSILFVDISYLLKVLLAFALIITIVVLSVAVHPECQPGVPPVNATSNATAPTFPDAERPSHQIPDGLSEFEAYFHTFVIPLTVFFFVMLTILLGTINRKSEISVRMSFKGRMEAVFQQAESKVSRNQIDSLVRHIIPKHVARELRLHGKYSRNHDCVGVMFATIVNFTEFCQSKHDQAIDCIRVLNEIVSEFDELLDQSEFTGVEKIKTIGSTYMAASGLNGGSPDSGHLINLISFALEMQNVIQRFHRIANFQLRVGFNYGQLTSGVVGSTRLLFDIWGDTVNVASRMDTTGRAGHIHLSESCRPALENYFTFQSCGNTEIKGRGTMATLLVQSKKRHIIRFVQPEDQQIAAEELSDWRSSSSESSSIQPVPRPVTSAQLPHSGTHLSPVPPSLTVHPMPFVQTQRTPASEQASAVGTVYQLGRCSGNPSSTTVYLLDRPTVTHGTVV